MQLKNLLIFLFFIQVSISNHAPSIEEMNKEYNPTTVGILEFLYGNSFLSQGGTAAIDRMFRGVSLHNKKMVDIGCGLGGSDFYLAKKKRVAIKGVDPLQSVITRAQQSAVTKKLDTKVTFLCTPSLPYPLADNSFDIAFSKEALLHCAEKQPLFDEVFRILKPGGQVIIVDWNFAENASAETQELFNIPTFSPITTQQYVKHLETAGFTNISTTALNKQYCRHTEQSLKRLKKNKDAVCAKFGIEEYNNALDSWNGQYDLYARNEVLVTLLKATKPTSTNSKPQPKNISQSIKNIFSQIPKLFSRKS